MNQTQEKSAKAPIRVVMVCLGNICRSPTAEAVFRKMVEDEGLSDSIEVDSAGTSDWHIGEAPDRRSQSAAKKRGYDMSSLRGRQASESDFETFDFVLAMDNQNLNHLRRLCPSGFSGELKLFLDFADSANEREVPDPYYGGDQGFEHVLDLVEAASRGLIHHIKRKFPEHFTH